MSQNERIRLRGNSMVGNGGRKCSLTLLICRCSCSVLFEKQTEKGKRGKIVGFYPLPIDGSQNCLIDSLVQYFLEGVFYPVSNAGTELGQFYIII